MVGRGIRDRGADRKCCQGALESTVEAEKKVVAVAFGSVKCSVVYQERSTKLSSSYEVSKRSTKCRASNQSSLWPFLLF